jgi:hypothetical protein
MSISQMIPNIHAFTALLQAQIPQCSGTSGANCLPITPFTWIPIAFLAVLVVIMIAAIVYMLSGIIRSDRARQWSRFQIYEAILSFLLIIAFASIAYIFFLNPQNLLGNQLNIVPCAGTSAQQSGCPSSTGSSTASAPGCTGATQLFTLASCDLSIFNNATFTIAEDTFIASYVVDLLPGVSGQFGPIPTGIGIDLKFSTPSLIPVLGGGQLISYFYDAVLLLLVFNQLQLVVVSASVLFLALFLSIGLIARTLGFTRTFGGAMIAFGLGIGIIYPLLIAITYGYIDVSAGAMCLQSFSCSFLTIFKSTASLIINPGTYQAAIWQMSAGTAGSLGSLGSGLGAIFLEIGYIIAGLTFIPVINIAIVDAFIIDFSSALGERMSFGELFSAFI